VWLMNEIEERAKKIGSLAVQLKGCKGDINKAVANISSICVCRLISRKDSDSYIYCLARLRDLDLSLYFTNKPDGFTYNMAIFTNLMALGGNKANLPAIKEAYNVLTTARTLIIKKEKERGGKNIIIHRLVDATSKQLLKICSIVHELYTEVDKVKNDPQMIDLYSKVRKNISFQLDLEEFTKSLKGRVNVVIRNGIDSDNPQEAEKTFMSLAKGVSWAGSFDWYYSRVQTFIRQALAYLFLFKADMFREVLSERFEMMLYIDIEALKPDVLGNVGESRLQFFNKDLYVKAYDPNLRWFEININSDYLFKCVADIEKEKFNRTLLHEFNHTFDRVLINNRSKHRYTELVSIRNEGIAIFSELAFTAAPRYKTENYIPELIKNPKNDLKLKDKDEPYKLGYFMCMVFYVATMRRMIMDKKLRMDENYNLLNDTIAKDALLHDVSQRWLATDISYGGAAKLVVRIMRGLTPQDFFRFYVKYSKELGMPLIFSDKLAKNMLNTKF
jgi:hypothetical protein